MYIHLSNSGKLEQVRTGVVAMRPPFPQISVSVQQALSTFVPLQVSSSSKKVENGRSPKRLNPARRFNRSGESH